MANITTPPTILYKQQSESDLVIQRQGNASFTEKWKGPYEKVQDIANNLYSKDLVPISQWSSEGLTEESVFNRPDCPDAGGWFFQEARVRQLEAGDLAELYVTWSLSSNTSLSVQWFEQWDVQWQPYSVDPYAFCANPTNHISAGSPALSSQRLAIEASLNLPYKDTEGKIKNKFYNGKVLVDLNANEIAIKRKKLIEAGCEYHRPVVVQTYTAYNIPASELSAGTTVTDKCLYDYIDVIVDSQTLENMSVVVPTGWTWVVGSSNVRAQLESTGNTNTPDYENQRYTVTVTNQFVGSLSADVNFYGIKTQTPTIDGRWKIGAM